MAHLGDLQAGVSELAAGIESSKAILGQIALPQFIAMMAEVLLLRNERSAAVEWLDSAIDVEMANDDRYFSAEIHRLSAVCLAAGKRSDAVTARLHKAIAVSRSQGARLFAMRAALTLAQYDPAEGCNALRSAWADFPEPEPWPEIEAARQMLH